MMDNASFRICAVIAECNPFHAGHEYLFRKLRETGADYIVLLLGGNYAQRGLPAVTDRHVRAAMAVSCGADLVLSYPTRYTVSSAESFAENAVRILSSLGCVDELAFGSESGSLAELSEAAAFFDDESGAFRDRMRELLKDGVSYPKARAAAAGAYGDIVSSPNNILAVEYLKALRRSGALMTARTIRRETGEKKTGAESSPDHVFPSASGIRAILKEDPHLVGIEKMIPSRALPYFTDDFEANGIVTADDLSLLLHEKLLLAHTPAELASYLCVTPELADAFFKNRTHFSSLTRFSEEMHTKNRTHSAVNRALLCTALGLRKEERFSGARAAEADFVQILGLRKESAPLLRTIKEKTRIPVVAKAADAEAVLSGPSLALFEEERRVLDLYHGIRARKCSAGMIPEAARPVFVSIKA